MISMPVSADWEHLTFLWLWGVASFAHRAASSPRSRSRKVPKP